MAWRTTGFALTILLLASCDSAPQTPENASATVASAVPNKREAAEPVAEIIDTRPSFDCAKASSGMEKLVCDDQQLAVLDREVARLYRLAEGGVRNQPFQLTELREIQRGWIKGRDDCWKNDDERTCVASQYAQRIHELRQGYAEARDEDARGISNGPLAVACNGMSALIGATFVNTEPGIVYLEWLNRGVALFQQRSGSGVRYTGTSFDGDYVFWDTGKDALFTRPEAGEAHCRIEEIG